MDGISVQSSFSSFEHFHTFQRFKEILFTTKLYHMQNITKFNLIVQFHMYNFYHA